MTNQEILTCWWFLIILGLKMSKGDGYRPDAFALFVLLLYVPSQQLWSLWDGQFT